MGKQPARKPKPSPTPLPASPPPLNPQPRRASLWTSPGGSSGSETLSPSDQTRMLVELLQPLGPEMVRRWVATLLLVDRDEREAMVEMVEKYVAENYTPGP